MVVVLPEVVHSLLQSGVLLANSTINVSIEFTIRRARSAMIPTATPIGHHFRYRISKDTTLNGTVRV